MSKIDQQTVKIIFSENMLKYQQMIEESTDTFTHDIQLLERDALDSIAKHLTRVSDEYQEKKDLVNEFVILNFNELKSAVDANFQIMRQQLESVNSNDALLLDQTQDAITENFKELSTKFETTVSKVLSSMSKAYASFKKTKEDTTALLLDQIRKNKELNEVFTISNFTEIMGTFATELIQKPRVINESIRKRTDEITGPIKESLANFESDSNSALQNFLQAHEANSQKLKEDVQQSLEKILDAQEKLSLGARASFLKVIKDESGEAMDRFNSVQKKLTKDFNEYLEEISRFKNNSLEKVDNFDGYLNKTKDKLSGILRGIPKEQEALKITVSELMTVVQGLRDMNGNYRDDLEETHNKKLKEISHDSNACVDECKDSIESVNKKLLAIEKVIEKKDKDISDDFRSKFTSIFSKANLETVLDNQTAFFQSFAKNFSDTMVNLKTLQASLINKAIEDLTVLNVNSFSELEQALKQEITAFIEHFKKLGGDASKSMKELALSIANEEGQIQAMDLKEYKDMLLGLSAYFDESMTNAQNTYEALFQNQYDKIFVSFDDMAGKLAGTVDSFKTEQEATLNESRSTNANVIARLKEMLDSQLKEFDDRLQLDLESLMNANQEIVGRIMVKSAETGSEFNNEAENATKRNKDIVYTFVSDIEHRMKNFQFIFAKVLEQIQDQIMEKLAKDRKDGPTVVVDE